MMDLPQNTPISDSDLRQLSRSLKEVCLSADPDCVSDLLRNLIETCETLDLSISHRVSACNVTCGLVETCIESSKPGLLTVAYSNNVWQRLLSLFLIKHDYSKPKSMKQVLNTLIRLLKSVPNVQDRTQAKAGAITHLFDALLHPQSRSQAKATMMCLSFFLSKKVATASDLTRCYSAMANQDTSLKSASQPLEAFLNLIFSWITDKDVANTAGALIEALMNDLKAVPFAPAVQSSPNTSLSVSLWTSAIVSTVSLQPESIHSLRIHVLLRIFKSEKRAIVDFVQMDCFTAIWSHLSGSTVEAPMDVSLLRVLIAALRAGHDLGLVDIEDTLSQMTCLDNGIDADSDARPNVVANGQISLPMSIVKMLCFAKYEDIRLNGLALLLQSRYITKPVNAAALGFVRTLLPQLYVSTDANFRAEVQSCLKSLLERMRAVLWSVHRDIAHRQSASSMKGLADTDNFIDTLKTIADYHQDFLTWLIQFNASELYPTASYQRHISALKCTELLLLSGVAKNVDGANRSLHARSQTEWPISIQVTTMQTGITLVNLLMDPFEDVRAAASRILNHLPSSRVMNELKSGNALNIATETMMGSGRMDHADGMARMYHLIGISSSRHDSASTVDTVLPSTTYESICESVLVRIEEWLERAAENLSNAVIGHSVQGFLIALRYLLENISHLGQSHSYLQRISVRITEVVANVWAAVRDYLCNDAPEGFIAEDTATESENEKDALSHAWRMLKESSLLLRTLVQVSMNSSAFIVLKDEAIFRRIGELCFAQMTELRHRGAFSTVTQTFASFCLYTTNSTETQLRDMTHAWYQKTLSLIASGDIIATRRSAGIPAIMTSILSANPAKPSFLEAMDDLEWLSSDQCYNVGDDNTLTRVHALNCLRAIFTTTKLGEVSDRFVSKGLSIAVESLRSPTWAIRNCGLMLFRSLIDRLLGTTISLDDSATTANGFISRLEYTRYPDLLKFILELLRSASAASNQDLEKDTGTSKLGQSTEAVFPVLELICRAPLPREYVRDAQNLLIPLASSTHWHIRDMTARAFSKTGSIGQITNMINMTKEWKTRGQNWLHGQFLCVKYLLRPSLEGSGSLAAGTLHDLTTALNDSFEQDYLQNPCLYTKAIYLEILDLSFVLSLRLVELSRQARDVTVSQDSVAVEVNTIDKLAQDLRANVAAIIESSQNEPYLVHACFRLAVLTYCTNQAVPTSNARSPFFIGQKELLDVTCELANKDPHSAAAALSDIASMNGRCAESTNQTLVALGSKVCVASGEMNVLLSFGSFITNELIRADSIIDPEAILDLQNAVLRVGMDTILAHSPSTLREVMSIWPLYLLGRMWEKAPHNDRLAGEVESYLASIRCSLDNFNDISERLSAAASLKVLHLLIIRTFDIGRVPETLLVRTLTSCYDLLVDDDDDVRLIGSDIVSLVIASMDPEVVPSLGLAPPEAVNRLFNYLVQNHNSDRLIQEIIIRLEQFRKGDANELVTMKSVIEASLVEDTTLFSIEKQNLYIDEAREVGRLAKCLLDLDLSRLESDTVEKISTWVAEGLDTFLELAESRPTGPLNWLSNPETYILYKCVTAVADTIKQRPLVFREAVVISSRLQKLLPLVGI